MDLAVFSPADLACMREALALGRAAQAAGEVPVGAVVVLEGRVIGRGANATLSTPDPTAHAEILALREAARCAGVARLPEATVYVTLEPCLMCLGAMIHARVARLVFAARDPKIGATDFLATVPVGVRGLNHQFLIQGGLAEQDAADLLRSFFRARRGLGGT